MYKFLILFLIILLAAFTSMANAMEIKEDDKNQDGKTDLWIFYEDKRPVKIERDSDADGRLETIFDISDRQTQTNTIKRIEVLKEDLPE
ncbi:MAG: hypothetical protein KJ706_03540 [Candidatus Omnitrophica bacterium]|nr:hypothetical protein [Candidatus Omnitrophota bacterium]MBU4589657.1 hypothetical protein [Candidatus Omnitrophota bacterium]